MSIKSDHWIRRMAASHGMIEPFEPGQVKTAADGHRIVSYGTSSYGYDVRCAREFKIFTNINSTIVDPKAFDEKSFVDVDSDVCIIPPNSFALARTVEFFRIPRSVLTVCLGKSTYARCGIIVTCPSHSGSRRWSSPIPLRCPPRSTPTRVSRRCCSLRATRCAPPLTAIVAASTRGRRV